MSESVDHTPDVKDDIIIEPTVDIKKEKRLTQLAAARESAKEKKRKREADLDSMNDKIDRLASMLKPKEAPPPNTLPSIPEDEPLPKRAKRVTRESDEIEDNDDDNSWTTSAVRTAACVTLAGASYYFNNVYGKHTKKKGFTRPTPMPQNPKKNVADTGRSMLHTGGRPPSVGASGFVI